MLVAVVGRDEKCSARKGAARRRPGRLCMAEECLAGALQAHGPSGHTPNLLIDLLGQTDSRFDLSRWLRVRLRGISQ